MSLIARNQSGNFQPTPTGMQIAVCSHVTDIHFHPNQNGVATEKCMITWELAEKMTDGRPYVVSKEYTLSLNEKANLRRDLEGWRGIPFKEEEAEAFDIEKLIGKGCLLNIAMKPSHGGTGKPYPKIMSIAPLMKGMITPEIRNEKAPEWVYKKKELGAKLADLQTQTPNAGPGSAAQAGEAEDQSPPF